LGFEIWDLRFVEFEIGTWNSELEFEIEFEIRIGTWN
jgi:hypothetical protein